MRRAQHERPDGDGRTIDLLLGLGDYQYGCSDAAEWAASYNPTWGFFNNIIDPSVGNHEYNTTTNSANGTPCPDANPSANDYFNYFGAVAHPGTAGEYSFNVGKWHLISLNANCANQGVGGCSASSPQTQWLSADLAANTQPCVMAYWHQPLWTATANNQKSSQPWWNLLYQYHTDVVLNGHIHTYARFAFLNPTGQVDNTNGIREVVVGTGGESLQLAASNANPFPLVNFRTFGYLKMILHPTGYDAQFITSAGVVKDSFSGTCHGSTVTVPPLTISQGSPQSVQADSSAQYVVTVHNPGSSDQTNVKLTDTPPANAMSISATPSTGSCTGTSTIVCNFGTLAAGTSATLTVQTTPIQPPTAVNTASVTSDQTSMVNNSQTVSVTPAPATSYVGVTNLGFQNPSPAVALGNTLQWDFVGPGAHSATDKTSGLGLFPDTGLVSPVDFRTQVFHWSGDYTFTDTTTEQHRQVRCPSAGGARDRVDEHSLHDHVRRRAPALRLRRGHPGRVPGHDLVGERYQQGDRHVDDVHAEQGHRQVQVPCAAAEPHELERDGVHKRRDHHGQLNLRGGLHRTDGAGRRGARRYGSMRPARMA